MKLYITLINNKVILALAIVYNPIDIIYFPKDRSFMHLKFMKYMPFKLMKHAWKRIK